MGGSFSPNANASATATKIYRYFVDAEGVFILYSAADPTGQRRLNEAGNGLFGCVIVQPPHAEYYRSQVLRTDLIDATYDSQKLAAEYGAAPAAASSRTKVRTRQHWLLTTYKTRLRDFVVKNVEVDVIGRAGGYPTGSPALPQVQAGQRQAQPRQAEQAKIDCSCATRTRRAQEAVKAGPWPARRNSGRRRRKARSVPEGQALPTLHGASADRLFNRLRAANRARPTGWPVLEMLYPEAKSLAGRANGELHARHRQRCRLFTSSSRTPKKLRQRDHPTGYGNRAARALAGAQRLGHQREPCPNITRVAPQRDYFDGTLDATKRVSRPKGRPISSGS